MASCSVIQPRSRCACCARCPSLQGAGADGGATPRFASYGATKRSLEQLGKSLSAELRMLKLKQIGVHNLSPGMVTTDLLMAGEPWATGGPAPAAPSVPPSARFLPPPSPLLPLPPNVHCGYLPWALRCLTCSPGSHWCLCRSQHTRLLLPCHIAGPARAHGVCWRPATGADTQVAKFFINCLAERPETVAEYLVPRVRRVPAETKALIGDGVGQSAYIRCVCVCMCASACMRACAKQKRPWERA